MMSEGVSRMVVAVAFVALGFSSETSLVMGVKEKEMMGMGTQIPNPLPDGDYTNSCDQCTITQGTSTLSCMCADVYGEMRATSLPNAWSCQNCITNIQGALVCQLPESAPRNGYDQYCSACSVNFGNLYCADCEGSSAQLANACSACANGVVSYSNGELVCSSAPTSAPTPPVAPPACASYWLNINGNGMEMAPWKTCAGTDFQNSNGCQYQNYCCWQPTSSSTGVCAVPNGVPVDCPTQTTQVSCQRYPQWCTWNASYNNGAGLCQRICPGDPTTMCMY